MQAELTVSGIQIKTNAGFAIWMPAQEALDLTQWVMKHEIDLQVRAWDTERAEEQQKEKKES